MVRSLSSALRKNLDANPRNHIIKFEHIAGREVCRATRKAAVASAIRPSAALEKPNGATVQLYSTVAVTKLILDVRHRNKPHNGDRHVPLIPFSQQQQAHDP